VAQEEVISPQIFDYGQMHVMNLTLTPWTKNVTNICGPSYDTVAHIGPWSQLWPLQALNEFEQLKPGSGGMHRCLGKQME